MIKKSIGIQRFLFIFFATVAMLFFCTRDVKAAGTNELKQGWFSSFDRDNVSVINFYCNYEGALPTVDSSTNTFSLNKDSSIIGQLNTDDEILNIYCKGTISLAPAAKNESFTSGSDGYFCGFGYLKEINNLNTIDTSNVTYMANMFGDCPKLTSLDLSNFNTSNVTTMYKMFYRCSSLTSLVLNNFNTSKVTNMSSMFQGCYKFTSLDLSSFDTSSVTDMSGMFFFCSNLISLDLSSFNTSKVTNMAGMFASCYSITSLDLSNFDTSNVTDMSGMFGNTYNYTYTDYGCSSLKSINLSSFSTSNVTTMKEMFYGCSSLISLDLNNFDTSKVKTMYRMFYCCSAISSIYLDNFNTSKVTSMYGMFDSCSNLTTLNLQSFNTKRVTEMYSMFDSCTHLNKIIVGNNWTTESVYTTMFYRCSNLVGEMGTTYSSSNVDSTYAHVDGGTSNPGYFWSSDGVTSFTVRFNNNGHGDTLSNQTVAKNGKITKPADLTASGYEFQGWYTDAACSDGNKWDFDNNTVTQSITLYAKWKYLFAESGYNVTIGGNFDLKYYIKVSDEISQSTDTYIQFKVGDVVQNVKPSYNKDNLEIYVCEVPARQLRDTITATLNYNGSSYTLSDYSIYNYLNTILKNSNNDAKYQEAQGVVTSILNYGGYAQQYFDYKENALANDTVDATLVSGLSDNDVASAITSTIKQYGDLTDFSYYGTSLVCMSDTTLKVYLKMNTQMTLDKFKKNYTITDNDFDNPITTSVENGLIVFSISDISAADLDNNFSLTIEKSDKYVTFVSSPFTYIKKAISNSGSTTDLKNLCKALYLYNGESESYFNKYSIAQ